MQLHEVQQGTPEWHDLRRQHHTASEAPVMMAASSKMRRDELLAMKSLGIEKEISEWTRRFLFSKGHEAEASIRPHIESMIEEELYPATGTNMVDQVPLLASFDGITLAEDLVFEHKYWNEDLATSVNDGEIPDEYQWQLDQQLLISGADKALFVVSDGTPQKMAYTWYLPDPDRFARLLKGWHQFDIDVAAYEHIVDDPKPEATAIMELPPLEVRITGGVQSSNMVIYEEQALGFINNIKTDLETDQDFADAEQTVKFCDNAEKQLELVKEQALNQTIEISQLFSSIDRIKGQLRGKRLMLEKLVKSQKEAVKKGIITEARSALAEYLQNLNAGLGGNYVLVQADFVGAAKNKRTLASLRGAVNDALAHAKIEASEIAEVIRKNLTSLEEFGNGHHFLFNDMRDIIQSDPLLFASVVKQRVVDYQKAEEDRLEREKEQAEHEAREKIRLEEEQKAREKAKVERKTTEELSRQEAPEFEPVDDTPSPPQEKREPTTIDSDTTPCHVGMEAQPEIVDAKAEVLGAIKRTFMTMGGFSEDEARKIVKMINRGQIPHVSIDFENRSREVA